MKLAKKVKPDFGFALVSVAGEVCRFGALAALCFTGESSIERENGIHKC